MLPLPHVKEGTKFPEPSRLVVLYKKEPAAKVLSANCVPALLAPATKNPYLNEVMPYAKSSPEAPPDCLTIISSGAAPPI